MSSTPDVLFDRLGGAAGTERIVTALYERVQNDSELNPYFHQTDMEEQRRKLSEMIGEALGGPKAPWLLDLEVAHRGRGVTHRHFSLLASHLVDTLEAFDVAADECDDVMSWFSQARSLVVDDA
jgi:hemoglobin